MLNYTVNTPKPDYDYSIYYRAFHNENPEHIAGMIEYHTRQLQPFLPDRCEGQALDIGCGMGFAMLALRKLGYHQVDGIDVDQSQIAASIRLGANGSCVTDSRKYLQDHPNTYDLVTFLDVLEHVPVAEQISLTRAIFQSLRPGGRVIVQVPNATFILASRWRYNDFTHFSSFTEHSLGFVLQNAGFQDVRIPPSERVYRPSSLRLWRSSERKQFKRRFRSWLVRFCWEQVVKATLPQEDISKLCFEPNLMAVAIKSTGEIQSV